VIAAQGPPGGGFQTLDLAGLSYTCTSSGTAMNCLVTGSVPAMAGYGWDTTNTCMSPDASIIITAQGSALFRSTDGGISFSEVTLPSGLIGPSALGCSTDLSQMLLGQYESPGAELYSSPDQGASFVLANPNPSTYATYPNGQWHGLAISADGSTGEGCSTTGDGTSFCTWGIHTHGNDVSLLGLTCSPFWFLQPLRPRLPPAEATHTSVMEVPGPTQA